MEVIRLRGVSARQIDPERSAFALATTTNEDPLMPLTLHQASVPAYLKSLGGLTGMLDKAAAYAAAAKFEERVLLEARIFPDMWPLSRQVQEATGIPMRGTARLAGLPLLSLSEASGSFDDLKARIAATVAFLKGVDPAAVDAGEDKDITFPIGEESRTMKGRQYLLTFSLPNFYFAVTTAYCILRHNGVRLDRQDFTGRI
jgi:hypothetical protein